MRSAVAATWVRKDPEDEQKSTKNHHRPRDSIPSSIQDRALLPQRDRSRSTHKLGIERLCKSSRIWCATGLPHRKNKETTPKGKAMCLSPCLIMCQCRSLEHRWKKEVSQLPTAIALIRKIEARHGGQLFNTASDRVRSEKKAGCFPLLR